MRYIRKTPVEAIQWNGDNPKEVSNFISPTTKSYCTLDDRSGNLNISYADIKGRKYKVVVPKFGWVVRDGKTLQFYKDATFRKAFEEVRENYYKGIDGEVMSNILKEALDGCDEFSKGFKGVFRAEPYKETLGAGLCITPAHIKIDNLYKGYEKTHEEVKLSDGLKEMTGSDTHKATFESVLDEMKELHAKKDKDYGSAFHKSFEEFGVTAGVVRLNDKMERVKSLVKNGKAEVKDDSLLDSLKDLGCYAVMLYVELKNKENGTDKD